MHHRVSSLTPCVLFVWLFVGANCQLNFNVKVSCPTDDIDNYVYFKEVEKCLNIAESNRDTDLCASFNGYSASISNDIVHQLILDNEQFKYLLSHTTLTEFYIGLTYDSQKKAWVWLDNTPLTIDKWATGQQDSSKPCVVWKNGFWHSRDCITSMNRAGFCESTPIYETAGVCDERFGWSMFKEEGKCLKKFSDRKSWSQAQQVCTAQGGNLLNIPDDTSVAFLRGTCDSGDRWVELKKQDCSSNWTWDTTTNNPLAHYPSGYWRLLKNKFQECSVITGGKSPKWKKSVKCTRNKKFICEVKCDAGWILFQPEKTCIKVVSGLSEMTTYSGAMRGCRRLGGDLITPRSIVMSMFIKAITSLHRRYWIKVVKIGNEFRKVEKCNVHHQLTFMNWDVFQPNMTSGDHVWIWNDKWSVASNDTIPANYICEQKLVIT